MARAEPPGVACGVMVGVQLNASNHGILGNVNRVWMFWGMGSGEERTRGQECGSTQAGLDSECGHVAVWPWEVL